MRAKSEPLLTVIVAVFNGEKTIQQCIDSVINQSYQHVELIIIDGGSSDGTVEILKKNTERISYWISEPDKGVYNAWNKALIYAKGEWVCFLGADDFLWGEQVFERISVQLTLIHSDICVAYTQIMLLTNDGESLFPIGEPWEKIKKRFKQIMCMPHQGVMHRRSSFIEYGVFDESFLIAGDYELLLRVIKDSDAVFIPDVILTGMRHGGMSSDPKHSLLALTEIRRAQYVNGLKMPGSIWFFAMLRVYIKILIRYVLGERLTKIAFDFGRHLMNKPSLWTKL